jgi:membrane associated rhomboid family serine protease
MLIIPLSGKISKKNLPFITIAIIVINALVYFIIQGGDAKKHQEAFEYYFKSGLARIEVTRYIAYAKLKEGDKDSVGAKESNDVDEKTIAEYLPRMMKDDDFTRALRHDEIITPQDEEYAEWKKLRAKHEELLSQAVSWRYGFVPEHPRILNIFTSMFLHGSFMHLLGNMIFLWLSGCILELGCGRIFYLALYLLSGICADGLFSVAYMKSSVPLIGASGAIAGLMGALTVLYGKRKIKIFYSLGFYFNYTKVSAIILLPLWIGNEVFQLFFGGVSNVAYVAHIGGLVGGALLGYGNRRFLGCVDEKAFEEDPKEKIPGLLENAYQLTSKLDTHKARPLVEEILEIEPHNQKALLLLFNIDKIDPQHERLHKTATMLVTLLTRTSEDHHLLCDIFKQYCQIAKPPRFTPSLLFSIAFAFCDSGYLQETEQIMASLFRNQPNHPKLPAALLKLARAYLKKGLSDKGKKFLQIISEEYPEANESKIAKDLLDSSR